MPPDNRHACPLCSPLDSRADERENSCTTIEGELGRGAKLSLYFLDPHDEHARGSCRGSFFRMSNHCFPPPWTIERLPGGFKVLGANGQSLAYFYARDNDHDASIAKVLEHGRGKADGEQLRQAAGPAVGVRLRPSR